MSFKHAPNGDRRVLATISFRNVCVRVLWAMVLYVKTLCVPVVSSPTSYGHHEIQAFFQISCVHDDLHVCFILAYDYRGQVIAYALPLDVQFSSLISCEQHDHLFQFFFLTCRELLLPSWVPPS